MTFRFRPIESVDDAVQRSAVYRLLGRIWLREVDAALLSDLAKDQLSESLALVSDSEFAPQSYSVDELSADYCQLFLGPSKHFPPYQSVWTSGQFESEPTAAMRKLLDLLGYQLPADLNVMPDHLGVQLDVMATILDRWAALHNDAEQAAALLEVATVYPSEHLVWCLESELLTESPAKAQTAFYRAFITMTREFLLEELVRGEPHGSS